MRDVRSALRARLAQGPWGEEVQIRVARTVGATRRGRKQRMVDYKGGACVLCGYSKCLRAMDFHHLDPSTKRSNIAPSHNRSWEALRLELDKCMLICSNCHYELEADSTGRKPRRDDPHGDSTCDRCGRRFTFAPRRGMTRNRCNSCRTNRATPKARRELKLWMIDYKGGACLLCGYRRHTRALTFHHVDPELKRFNIAPSHNRARTLCVKSSTGASSCAPTATTRSKTV